MRGTVTWMTMQWREDGEFEIQVGGVSMWRCPVIQIWAGHGEDSAGQSHSFFPPTIIN
jgi:hypothetical protein